MKQTTPSGTVRSSFFIVMPVISLCGWELWTCTSEAEASVCWKNPRCPLSPLTQTASERNERVTDIKNYTVIREDTSCPKP